MVQDVYQVISGVCYMFFDPGAITASDQSAYSPTSVVGLVPAECVSSTVLAATIAVAEGAIPFQSIVAAHQSEILTYLHIYIPLQVLVQT